MANDQIFWHFLHSCTHHNLGRRQHICNCCFTSVHVLENKIVYTHVWHCMCTAAHSCVTRELTCVSMLQLVMLYQNFDGRTATVHQKIVHVMIKALNLVNFTRIHIHKTTYLF